jgi:micrococcal nuclease
MKKLIILLSVLIVALTALVAYVAVDEENNIAVNIIDGDTFQMSGGETVRLLSIDAPEKGAYYYQESKEKLAELIKNKQVFLEKDETDKDKYGRLLRYAYVEEQFINEILVKEGYAKVDIYKPDVKYEEKLEQAERIARVLEIGVWQENKEENLCCTALGCPKGTSYIGSKNSDKFHSCRSTFARMISPDNIVCFRSKNEAIIQGYEPGDVS